MEHDKYIESDGQAEDYFTGDESTASLTSSVNDYVFENGTVFLGPWVTEG